MKYILAFIGMLIGKLGGEMFTGSYAIGWIAGVILALISYQIPTFFRYAKSSPKQLLAFHGPDAPITKTKSSGELRAFLSQLHDGGFLLDFDPKQPNVALDETQWENLSEPERTTLCRVLTQAAVVHGNAPPELSLLDRKGRPLASYLTAEQRLDT